MFWVYYHLSRFRMVYTKGGDMVMQRLGKQVFAFLQVL